MVELSTSPAPGVRLTADDVADIPLVPRPDDPGHAGMDRDTTAWTALDISDARDLIAQAAAGERGADWVLALLAKTRIVEVDENAGHWLGPAGGRKQMIGQPIMRYWPPESWSIVAELIVATAAARGGTRSIASNAFADAVINISTDPAHPDLVFLSVGGRLKDERSLWSLRASEERYRTLIHHLPWALVQVDSRAMLTIFENLRREGVKDIAPYLDANPDLPGHSRAIVHVTDANRNAVELFAASSADQLIGPVDYLFAASPESAKRVITAHFEGRRNLTEIMKLRTFDGRLRDVQLSITYPTPPERLDITLLMFEDVTDRLRTEAELRQLQADYSRAARIATLGELASSIAHEVNQPLAAIAMNAETSLRWLAREELNTDKVRQLITRIADSARLASGIVQRIRGMAGRNMPEPVPLDLDMVVAEALLFVRHDIDTRAIRLVMALAGDLPPILGDRVQLQQVIVNLLVNSLQALSQQAPGEAQIWLATARHDNEVHFEIRDNGPGIAPEDVDRVFDGFFTTKTDGMGIGLAVCQSIIAAHGGGITAANHPQGGAVFRFTLPVIAGS